MTYLRDWIVTAIKNLIYRLKFLIAVCYLIYCRSEDISPAIISACFATTGPINS